MRLTATVRRQFYGYREATLWLSFAEAPIGGAVNPGKEHAVLENNEAVASHHHHCRRRRRRRRAVEFTAS